MATLSRTDDAKPIGGARERIEAYPAGSLAFDWIVTVLGLLVLGGTYLDGWAHNSFPENIDTFLTPWHVVLYAGMGLAGTVLTTTWVRNLMRGHVWLRALPRGYMLSLLGFVLFGAGGLLDFTWHSLFGFEVGVEPLLSPPHLLLGTGAVLVTSGPLRSVWQRTTPDMQRGWRALGPGLLTLFGVLSTGTFFMQFANIFGHAHNFVASRSGTNLYIWDSALVGYVLYPALLMMFSVLLALRRWELPRGALLLFLGGSAALMFIMTEAYNGEYIQVLIAGIGGALIAEVLYAVLKPSVERVGALRLFAFSVPFIVFVLALGSLLLTVGITWRIHMWLGAPFLAGIAALGMSFLLAPPRVEE